MTHGVVPPGPGRPAGGASGPGRRIRVPLTDRTDHPCNFRFHVLGPPSLLLRLLAVPITAITDSSDSESERLWLGGHIKRFIMNLVLCDSVPRSVFSHTVFQVTEFLQQVKEFSDSIQFDLTFKELF
jgi:hypothetical protein